MLRTIVFSDCQQRSQSHCRFGGLHPKPFHKSRGRWARKWNNSREGLTGPFAISVTTVNSSGGRTAQPEEGACLGYKSKASQGRRNDPALSHPISRFLSAWKPTEVRENELKKDPFKSAPVGSLSVFSLGPFNWIFCRLEETCCHLGLWQLQTVRQPPSLLFLLPIQMCSH